MPREPAYVLGMSPAILTADELLQIPDKHAELVRGVLVVREPPGLRHGRIALELGRRLADHVAAGRLGRVYVESGFKLTSNPDTVRGPDIAFIRETRLPEPEPVGYPALAPDLVVEILSPSDRPGDVLGKVADWLSAGTRLAWVVDPERRLVRIYRADGVDEIVTIEQALDGEDVVPGFACSNVARLTYEYQPASPPSPGGRGGQGVRTDERAGQGVRPPAGGGRYRGIRARTGVNTDSLKQPDARLRALDAQASTPGAREEVYCTKVGSVHPGEMYIVGAHMDGIGWGEAANDDGSGTALVMQLARIFSGPDVRTDRSIRFILWNNEETGLNGSRAYVEQRRALQGSKDEPKWLGMIQHDMMLFDHGMPRADGTLAATQRPEADVNIEFQTSSKFAVQAQLLAWTFERAHERYATDYPASVGSHMTNTDSAPFQDYVPAISLRENERGTQIGAGWDPNLHQPTDRHDSYSDKDFRLGLNAAQTTLAALAGLAGATIK